MKTTIAILSVSLSLFAACIPQPPEPPEPITCDGGSGDMVCGLERSPCCQNNACAPGLFCNPLGKICLPCGYLGNPCCTMGAGCRDDLVCLDSPFGGTICGCPPQGCDPAPFAQPITN